MNYFFSIELNCLITRIGQDSSYAQFIFFRLGKSDSSINLWAIFSNEKYSVNLNFKTATEESRDKISVPYFIECALTKSGIRIQNIQLENWIWRLPYKEIREISTLQMLTITYRTEITQNSEISFNHRCIKLLKFNRKFFDIYVDNFPV